MASTIKRVRIDPNETLKQLKEMFDKRMHALERKMEFLINTCTTILGHCDLHKKGHANSCCAQLIMPKIRVIDNYIRSVKNAQEKSENFFSSNAVLLLPNGNKCNLEPQIIELLSEKDLPSGSWLGDEDNPKARVRVDISPDKLQKINETCLTPEKMALALLDLLFPREVLAVSNLSGKGKHSKKQLDPLLIYAIRCHLIFKFNITEQDWHRIKQNLDSKCRTIWKKNNIGINLTNNNNNNNNWHRAQNGFHENGTSFTNEIDSSNHFSSSGCFRSRSNSPLKNISTLPLILEEPDSNDFADDDYISLLKVINVYILKILNYSS
ncbi:hypothetical protein O3M35_002478 [Rhynocoris fuscipes]|uniref:Protein BANP n=1 Tax=Rhynocoris fuscipes TaxID=488301 RepID=A0AAW1CKG4_9HEMI